MKLKYLALATFLLSSSASVFASDIFCPQTMMCNGINCMPVPFQSYPFTNLVILSPTIPTGHFNFSEAYSYSDQKSSCSYRDKDGTTWLYLQSPKQLPPAYSNMWKKNGSGKKYTCTPDTAKPYWADAQACPFVQ